MLLPLLGTMSPQVEPAQLSWLAMEFSFPTRRRDEDETAVLIEASQQMSHVYSVQFANVLELSILEDAPSVLISLQAN